MSVHVSSDRFTPYLVFRLSAAKTPMLYSRMQAKQSTESRFQTGNIEGLAWKQSGKPLTKRELAGFLGVSERFLEMEINRGRLRAVRLSNRLLRFRQIDVERWMESSLTGAAELG